RHTRSKRDWSSDVCSSDLTKIQSAILLFDILENKDQYLAQIAHLYLYLSEYQWKSGNQNEAFNALENAKEFAQNYDNINNLGKRSEERRVGKEYIYGRAEK